MRGLRSETGAGFEWRRGGHLVALTAIGITCAPTTLPVYSIGVFVAPFEQSFGWGRGAIQTAILFSTGLGVLCAPLAGWMVRRFGIRRTILPGLTGLAVALVLASAMTGALWQLYAVYALMSLLGAGAGAVGWTSLLAARFDKARGLALGLGLSGTGLCAMLMPQIALFGISIGGWRSAYLALCAFVLLVILPLCFLILPKQDNGLDVERSEGACIQKSGMDVKAVVKTRRFWLLGLATACIYLAIGGIIPNLVPALADRGLSGREAATILGAFGTAIIAGRIGIGALVDRFWAPAVAATILFPASLGCVIMAFDGANFLMCLLAAALLGAAAGMELDVLGFLAARYFGLKDFARIYGRAYIFVAAAAGIAPLMFGHLYDLWGSYALPLIMSAGFLACGALALLMLGRYPEDKDFAPHALAQDNINPLAR